jgi:hypothetical protein
MLRPLLVFIHVASAMTMFAAFAIEFFTLRQLRRVTEPAQQRAALVGFRLMPVIGGPGLLFTIASGSYLAVTVWGWTAAWIRVGFSSLLLISILGVAMNLPVVPRMLKTETVEPRGIRRVWFSFVLRVFLFLGILFLMTVKPPMAMALEAMSVAAVLGLVVGGVS